MGPICSQRRELIKKGILLPVGLQGFNLSAFPLESEKKIAPVVFRDPDSPLESLGFGSCNRQNLDQSFWNNIVSFNPELWLWLGDNIYGDNLDPKERWKEYNRVLTAPGYEDLMSMSEVIGIWDDHDFGYDNAGSRYDGKAESQQLFLDFIGVPIDSIRRQREGIYTHRRYGPQGRQVSIFSLAARYFRERPDTGASMLGEKQWRWFERQVDNCDSELMIIASSVQFFNPYSGLGLLETWNQYPDDKNRLISLLKKKNRPTIILSGDRHLTEISEGRISQDTRIYEITSSGLTHANGIRLPNSYCTWGQRGKTNFGMLYFDWNGQNPRVEAEIINPQNGEVFKRVRCDFSPSSDTKKV